MNRFRRAQEHAHPNKKGVIMSTLIIVLLINVLLQIWLLYISLNNALEGNTQVAVISFAVSLVLFLVGFFWLYLLPKSVK